MASGLEFKHRGDLVPLIDDVEKWTLGEVRAVERWIGLQIDEMSKVDQMAAAMGISIKRVRPDYKLRDTDDIELGVIQDMVDKAEAVQADAARSDTGPVPTGVGDGIEATSTN